MDLPHPLKRLCLNWSEESTKPAMDGQHQRVCQSAEPTAKKYWLVVWNINFIFPYIGNNHPNWLIFFRGVAQPPTRIGFWTRRVSLAHPHFRTLSFWRFLWSNWSHILHGQIDGGFRKMAVSPNFDPFWIILIGFYMIIVSILGVSKMGVPPNDPFS